MSVLALAALKVAIIAGGDTPEANYHSHLVHVQQLAYAFDAHNLPQEDITIFWADGVDPAPDRAIRAEEDVKGAWLLHGTEVDEATAVPLTLENTEWRGRDVRPAKRAEIQRWLREVGPALGPDDGLLIAVTDHGVPDPTGGVDSAISLWGEAWSVSQMAVDLAPTASAGRVVLWMSQCHSGGFDALYTQLPNVCGTFSTTVDRVAYGCYPDLAQRTDVGHFLRTVYALGDGGRIDYATDLAMSTDVTPDVPHLMSDALLWSTVAEQAEATRRTIAEVMDKVPTRQPDDTLEDVGRLARLYGLGPLPSYAALEKQLVALDDARFALLAWMDRWQEPLDMIRAEGVAPWSTRFIIGANRARTKDRRALREGAVALARKTLLPQKERWRRARIIHSRLTEAEALLRQLEQREAVALRAAYLFARRAGPGLLDAAGEARLEALRRCESESLWPVVERGPGVMAHRLPPRAEHTVEALTRQVEGLRPGYAGAQFEPAARSRLDGAVAIKGLLKGGAAAQAGLRKGDVITAIDGAPLEDKEAFLTTLMLTPPGASMTLTLRRAGELVQVRLTPKPAPLPTRPLSLGAKVPDLKLEPLSGELPKIGDGRAVVLFFWATWCRPCKAALPALKSWAKDHDALVIAVSGEAPEDVRRFLSKFERWPGFPVAIDASGLARDLFRVASTPTFIRVDPAGVFVDEGEGYDKEIPLSEGR